MPRQVMGYMEPFSFHSSCQHSVTEMKPSLWTGILLSNLSIYRTGLCQVTFRCWDCLSIHWWNFYTLWSLVISLKLLSCYYTKDVWKCVEKKSHVNSELIIGWQNWGMLLLDQRQTLHSEAPSAFDLLKQEFEWKVTKLKPQSPGSCS